MKLNNAQRDKLINFIKLYEGCKLLPYLDPVGLRTIGIGHMIQAGENFDSGITIDFANQLLLKDLQTVFDCIDRYVKPGILNSDGRLIATIDFCYNVGIENFINSTFLKKLNNAEYNDAANELLRWVRGKDGPLPGLVVRRQTERNLFLGI